MKDFVEEFLEYMISKKKRLKFGLEEIKYILIYRFDKKTLMYKHHFKFWIKEFFDIIRVGGYGKYDKSNMMLILTPENEFVSKIIFKYNLKFEKPKKEKKENIDKYDELIK